ncbi:MAG: threonine--tRNA ligase [Propylenella sp.]
MSKVATSHDSAAASSAINKAGERYIPPGYDPALYRVRHSAAHVLAQAVKEYFADVGPVLFGIGPPIADGFYYDFVLPRPLSEDELPELERRMKDIIRAGHPFEGREVTAEQAKTTFRDQPFKLELIDGLARGAVDENGNPAPQSEHPPITVFQQGTFLDLCRGPHVADTNDLDPEAVRLLNTSGVFWRGSADNPTMTRVYGTAWRTKEELERFEWQRAEAERRDHRRLGKQLGLFHFDPTAPGMPYWLPNGLIVLNALIDFWRKEHKKRGYREIASPLINRKELWEQSGHWDHYRENMFIIPIDEHTTYAVKPMNCPNAMIVFNLKTRSYRDLPLRLSDCDPLHRHEASGALHGLLRVQMFSQDDAHIFVTEDQIEDEYGRILEICDQFYSIFGLQYRLRLGTRPTDYIGDLESWNRAEAALRRILDGKVGDDQYEVADGDGAFYGPKIDILMEDSIGRSWQMGTIQLDFQLPRRFDCRFTDKDGTEKSPVVIHRVIYGSLERFIGILIEHCAGAFPLWIAPVQARIVPIADRHIDYALHVQERLESASIRCEVDDSSERMNAKVRMAQVDKVPYILVVGDKEAGLDAVSVRLRTEEVIGAMPVGDLISRMTRQIEQKSISLD